MSSEVNIELYVGIGMTSVILILFIIFGILLCKKMEEQPIKSKSPRLLMMSIIGNFISILVLGAMVSFGTFFENNEDEDKNVSILFIGLPENTLIFTVIISECVGVPLMLFPHALRALQYYNIYNVTSEAITRPPNDPRRQSQIYFQMVKSSHYMKLMLVVELLFGAVAAVAIYSYFNWLEGLSMITLRDFVVLSITSFCNFLILLILLISSLRLIRFWHREITINSELLTLALIWGLTSLCFHSLILVYKYFYDKNKREDVELQVIVISGSTLCIRNISCFFVSVVYPLVRSNAENILPYGETRECLENVDITLATELPYLYFSKFIEEKFQDNGGCVNIYGL